MTWLLALLAACGWWAPAPPSTVVLVVLDTVRADHTGLCGHERPTSPHLDALAARSGARAACRAYAPAPWTHPSHASLFTGQPVEEHGAVWVGTGAAIAPDTQVRPLPASAETLAERFAARGYQTALLSANPLLVEGGGLQQGFEQVRVARRPMELRGRAFREALEAFVGALDAQRPLFLVVNIYDAHDPYPALDGSLPWGGRQPGVHLVDTEGKVTRTFGAFVAGTLSDEEEEAALRQVADGYDGGVHGADANLGAVLEALQARGRLADARVVVTSDHGELLGEHRLLRHGGFLWEEVLQVPVVAWDSSRPLPALPEPFAVRSLFDLLLDGRVEPVVATAVSDNPGDEPLGVVGAARWEGTRKGTVVDGRVVVTDLARDPLEIAGMVAAEEDPWVAELRELGERVRAVRVQEGVEAPGVGGVLRAMGYVE